MSAWRLKNHGHHRMLLFLSWDALQGLQLWIVCGAFCLQFVFSYRKTCSTGPIPVHWRILHYFEKPWEILGFAFCIIHLHCGLLHSFVAFSSIWLENSLVHFSLVFLSAVTSSINSTDLVQYIPLPLHCLHNVWLNLWYFRDYELSLSLVHLGFICSKNCAEIFPSKFILGVLFSTNGLHLVVNTLNLDSCRCFLIADFDIDTTPWRVLHSSVFHW